MDFAIQACDITVNYPAGPALRAVSFGVAQGEFIGIVGPNGSGKTTLLRSLAGNVKPASGAVVIEGRNLAAWNRKEIARRLGVVPQRTVMDFAFTVREVVSMGRYPHRAAWAGPTPADEAAVATAIAATGLVGLEERLVTEVSGGEWQRVIIAQALAQEPKLLLLDEPTAHLDLSHQIHLLELLRQLRDQGALTIIAVLHDLNLAARYCDRLLLLAGGAVQAAGRPEEVLTAARIREVFGADMRVNRDEATGRPVILPGLGGFAALISPAAPTPPATPTLSGTKHSTPFAEETPLRWPKSCQGLRVHVVCGGGSGVWLLRGLREAGCTVTAGVLNRLDTDSEAARLLGVTYVEEVPFSPIGEAADAEHRNLARQADLIVLADLPFGRGNLKNLAATLDARLTGQEVLVYDFTSIGERDFADGEAQRLYSQLREAGARFAVDAATLTGLIDKLARDYATNPQRGPEETGKEDPH